MFRYCGVVGLFVVLIKGQDIDDTCSLSSGSSGQCTLFSQCPSAIRSIRTGIKPQLCGFMGSEPIVCCIQESSPISVSKSRKKCEEYLRFAKLPTPPGIVNGESAEVNEFPHIAALGFGEQEDIKWLCGGSLISEQFILTAAHCLESPDYGPVKFARLGTTNLQDPSRGGSPQDFKIVNRTRHPSYRPPSTYNDIALLEIDKRAGPTKYVHPACINTEFTVPNRTEAIGWGRVQFTESSSNALMKVTLELYPNEICNKSYAKLSNRALAKGIDDESQICAGGSLNESKDTCQGDSGGPLHVPLDTQNFISIFNIVGITSFGKACGVANIPGVYTRVSHFVPWIESVVWP